MKKLLVATFSIIIIAFIYGIYDGYVEKKLKTKENIHTFVPFDSELVPQNAYTSDDFNDEQIEKILYWKKELEKIGYDKFVEEYGEIWFEQTARIIRRYKYYQLKLKLQKAHIKRNDLCENCLIGTVTPVLNSFIQPTRVLMNEKLLATKNVMIDGKLRKELLEVHDDGTYTSAGDSIYKSVDIEFKKINNFTITKLKMRIGNMDTYEPFKWKNSSIYTCELMQAYESLSFCHAPLPLDYNHNDISAFQFVEIKGYKKPITIIRIIAEPFKKIGTQISYLFSRD